MKTIKKIWISSAIVFLIVALLYLLMIFLVMPGYYQRQMPEGWRVNRAGFSYAEISGQQLGGIKFRRIILKFAPGRKYPDKITLSGFQAEAAITDDNRLLVQGKSALELTESLRRRFESMPAPELRFANGEVDLTWRGRKIAIPSFILDIKPTDNDYQSFTAHVTAGKFKMRALYQRDKSLLEISPKGTVALSVLAQALSFPENLRLTGSVQLAGMATFNTVERSLTGSDISGIFREASLSYNDLQATHVNPAQFKLNGNKIEGTGLVLTKPFKMSIANYSLTLPEPGTRLLNFSGQAGVDGNQDYDFKIPGLHLIYCRGLKSNFQGHYNLESGLWAFWSESQNDTGNAVLRYQENLLNLNFSKVEWRGQGREGHSAEFSLNLQAPASTLFADTGNTTVSDAGLKLNVHLNNGMVLKGFNGNFSAARAEGAKFNFQNFKGTLSAQSDKPNAPLSGKLELEADKGTLGEARFERGSLAGTMTWHGLLGNKDFEFKLNAASISYQKIECQNPDFTASLALTADFSVNSGKISGKSMAVNAAGFTMGDFTGSATLENQQLTAEAAFDKSYLEHPALKTLSPAGQIKLSGTLKPRQLIGTMTTGEVWLMSENYNGKLDKLTLSAQLNPDFFTVRLDSPEALGELGKSKIRSGQIAGTVIWQHDPVFDRWELNRDKTGVVVKSVKITAAAANTDIDTLKITAKNIYAAGNLTMGNLQLKDFELTQELPGDGTLAANLISGGKSLGEFSAAAKLVDGHWQFKGGQPLPLLNRAVINYSGELNGKNFNPELLISYRIPGYSLPQPVNLGILDSGWRHAAISGDGSLHGDIAINSEAVRHTIRAEMNNVSLTADDWSMNGIRGKLEIEDLASLMTQPHQALTFGNMVIGGYELNDGMMVLHGRGLDNILIEHMSFNCFNGRNTLSRPLAVNSSRETMLEFKCERLDGAALLSHYGLTGTLGQCRLNGSVTMKYEKNLPTLDNAVLSGFNGTLRIPGLLKYMPGAPSTLRENGYVPFICAVLENFIYRQLKVTLAPGNIKLQGEGHPASNVPFRHDSAGMRFVKVDPIDGIGSELEIDTEIKL